MKDSLRPGITKVRRLVVDRDRTISFMGEDGRVYGTPDLGRDIEHVCRDLLFEHAHAGEDSVGIEIALRHTAATLPGMEVEITATVTAVEGRKVTLEFSAEDELEPIGAGSRPPVNAINDDWVRLLSNVLDDLAARPGWVLLHLRSNQSVFCAGADLAQVRDHIGAPHGPDRMYAYVAGLQRLYRRIEEMPQVTIAEIGGAAIGGGLELALACDLRIAAADAKVGLPEARLGLIPGAGGTQRLTRLCGRSVAARLILGAEVIDGSTAQKLGVVQWAVPRADLSRRAAEIATRIAALPAAALAWSKACIAAAGEPGDDGFRDELEATRRLLTSVETRRRVEAFFGRALQ